MLVVIFCHAIVIAVQTYDELYSRAPDVFLLLDNAFLGIYVMEILFKWYYGFADFWRSSWNLLDLFITVATICKGCMIFLLCS